MIKIKNNYNLFSNRVNLTTRVNLGYSTKIDNLAASHVKKLMSCGKWCNQLILMKREKVI